MIDGVVDPHRPIIFTLSFTTCHLNRLWQKLWYSHYSLYYDHRPYLWSIYLGEFSVSLL